MRTIGVVTTSRADYGIYLPLLHALKKAVGLKLQMYVSGTHLSSEYGMTINHIQNDGFEIVAKIESVISSDSPQAISKSMGLTTIGFAQVFSEKKPDILVVLGDRYEMFASVIAAIPFRIPIAHIHGGEITMGAFDEGFRHSITKFSHLHFASNNEYAKRIKQLGEEAWRVSATGAPSLDNIKTLKKMTQSELEDKFKVKITNDTLLVTFHPVTLDYENAAQQISNLLEALDQFNNAIIFTMPNSDTMGLHIGQTIKEYVNVRDNACLVKNFGMQAYFSAMTYARAMVGNSSSGIIEAASFKLPVVNIGERQTGRIKGKNIIDCECKTNEIAKAIRLAASEEFRQSIKKIKNPYGNGNAAKMIVDKLTTIKLDRKLLIKKFIDCKV